VIRAAGLLAVVLVAGCAHPSQHANLGINTPRLSAPDHDPAQARCTLADLFAGRHCGASG
jgi:hypothetical protein